MSNMTLKDWREWAAFKARRESERKSLHTGGGNFWEKFAILVSVAAAGISLIQTYLMREQLTASNTNDAINQAIDAAMNFCNAIYEVPFDPIVTPVLRDDGSSYNAAVYLQSEIMKHADPNRVRQYSVNLAQSQQRLNISFIRLRHWIEYASPYLASDYLRFYYELDHYGLDLKDYRFSSFFGAVNATSADCYSITSQLLNELSNTTDDFEIFFPTLRFHQDVPLAFIGPLEENGIRRRM